MYIWALVYASSNYCHCNACLIAPWDAKELSPLECTQHSLEHTDWPEVERGGIAEAAPWSQDFECVLRPGITGWQDKVSTILLAKSQPQPGMGAHACTLSTWWQRQEDLEVTAGPTWVTRDLVLKNRHTALHRILEYSLLYNWQHLLLLVVMVNLTDGIHFHYKRWFFYGQ